MTTPFLQQVAQSLSTHSELDKLTIVFPNKRSSLSFYRYLFQYIHTPIWEPQLFTISDLFSTLSTYDTIPHLFLVKRLYQIYTSVTGTKESFYRFYFWGTALLQDFDEIDKQLIDASTLFRNLSYFKSSDASYDILEEEQKEALMQFWQDKDWSSIERKNFLRIWDKLLVIYENYLDALQKDGVAYEGMIQRIVAEDTTIVRQRYTPNHIVFVGFNALTQATEKLMSYCVEHGAQVYWDTDAYYMKDDQQEAGFFLRKYQQHPILSRTFQTFKNNIQESKKNIEIIGVSQLITQSQLLGKNICEDLKKGIAPEDILVVLLNETNLLPSLHALPQSLEHVNVTMDYPLKYTSTYSMLDDVLNMQAHRSGNSFYYKEVLILLNNPCLHLTDAAETIKLRQNIIRKNIVYIHSDKLQALGDKAAVLFRPIEIEKALSYLIDVATVIKKYDEDKSSSHETYATIFYETLLQISHMEPTTDDVYNWSEFRALIQHIFATIKLSFMEDKHRGLQIMDMMGTRNLDFKCVHILSFNEGVYPPSHQQKSYIPYRVRKAFHLSTYTEQDAKHAYLFYRLLQRSHHVRLYYSTIIDHLGKGEMSRYVAQLIYEMKMPVRHVRLESNVNLPITQSISIQKNKNILKEIAQHQWSASSINDYLDCRLRFYFKYILKMKLPSQVEEGLDRRMFGIFFHDAAYWFYHTWQRQNHACIQERDLKQATQQINCSIDHAFSNHYGSSVRTENRELGQHVIAKAILKEWMIGLIKLDKADVPFELIALEKKIITSFTMGHYRTIYLKGIIDRVDRCQSNLRIIDYKTGGDKPEAINVASLLERNPKRSKASLQLMFYSYLYAKGGSEHVKDCAIVPMIIKNDSEGKGIIKYYLTLGQGKNKTTVTNAHNYFDDFEKSLISFFDELYDENVPFNQTEHIEQCNYCPYNTICAINNK